jgi:hypothetical protein
MTASARACVAEGRECADSHANAGGVLEGLVAQAKGGGRRGLRRATSCRAGSKSCGGARALSVGQRRCSSAWLAAWSARQTSVGNWASCEAACAGKSSAVIRESDMQVSPRVKRGTAGDGEGVYVGGSCGEGSGSSRRGGKEGGSARFGGKACDVKAPKAQRQMELYAGGGGI